MTCSEARWGAVIRDNSVWQFLNPRAHRGICARLQPRHIHHTLVPQHSRSCQARCGCQAPPKGDILCLGRLSSCMFLPAADWR